MLDVSERYRAKQYTRPAPPRGAVFAQFWFACAAFHEANDPAIALYRKARDGLISHFTGIDSDYEVPERPELSLKTSDTGAEALTPAA